MLLRLYLHDKKIIIGTYNSPEILKGYSLIGLRELFPIINSDDFFILSKSLQIYNWSKQHKFCGACGQKTLELMNVNFQNFAKTVKLTSIQEFPCGNGLN